MGKATMRLCGLIAVFVSGAVLLNAPAQAQGFKRTMLQTSTFPGSQYVTALYVVDIDAGASVPLHTHPGLETIYILEGEMDLAVDGQPDRHLRAGDSVQIPAGTAHGAAAPAKPIKVLATYVVETIYILEGEMDLAVDGQPDRHLKAGDSVQIPAGTAHGAAAPAKPIKVLATYVVEKDKPLATIIPKK